MDADLTVVIDYALASLSCRLPGHRILLSPRNSVQRASRVRVYVPDSGCEFSGPQYLLKPFEGGFKVLRYFFITHCLRVSTWNYTQTRRILLARLRKGATEPERILYADCESAEGHKVTACRDDDDTSSVSTSSITSGNRFPLYFSHL